MDVQHDVTDDERRPDRAESALRERQKKEDAETLRVRGPQRPADTIQSAAQELATPHRSPAVQPIARRPLVTTPQAVSPVVVHPPSVAHPIEKPFQATGHSDESKDR